MPETVLHPVLQKLAVTHRRRLRLLSLALFMTVAGALMFAIVTALTSQKAGSLLLLGMIGLLLLPVVASLGGLMWYVDRRLSRGLHEADRLLKDCPPRDARLTPLGRGDGMGVLATLRLATARPAPAEPVHALINPSFRWSAPPPHAIDVRLYCRELAPDSAWAALGSDGALLVGKVVDREAHRRRRQRLTVALAVLVLLVAVLAGVQLSNW